MRSGLPTVHHYYYTTTPFEVEGREVGYSTVYDEYMVWYIVGFRVSYNHFNIYGYCIYVIIFTT